MKRDLAGRRFGRLTAVRLAGCANRWGSRVWECICDCGSVHKVAASHLVSGTSRSCGCLKRERSVQLGKQFGTGRRVRHGHSLRGRKSPEYTAWCQIRGRCLNTRNAAFSRYGGRGILLCDRWATFENFLADMGLRPSSRHSIDRIDNDRGYAPDNCRWATDREQSLNRRNNVRVAFDGKTMPLKEWARELDVNYGTLWSRINDSGWSVERALTTPIRRGSVC